MKKYLMIILIIFSINNIYSASVNVDELTIVADGHFNKGIDAFEANTYFKFVTSFDGGYKFAAQVAFEANVKELETYYAQSSTLYYNTIFLFFRNAIVSARNLADSHLELSLWTGTYKYLGAGNFYKGYIYYPQSINQDYQGFYRLRGTGITTSIKFWEDRFRASFHFYENTNFLTIDNPTAFYFFSFDTEIGLYFIDIPIDNETFSVYMELFAGVTFPIQPYGQYKAGIKFGVGNSYIDFFISAGVPKIDANIATMTFDDVYLAADLHFKLLTTDHIISFLTRPLWYNEQKYGLNEEGDKSDIDINYNFNITIPDTPLNTGFVFNFQYSLNDSTDPWRLYISPFLDIAFSGIIWQISTHYDFSRLYIANMTGADYKTYLEGLSIIVGATSKF